MLKAKKPCYKPYPKELKTYGDHIRKKRLDLNLSQPQVAKIINVTPDTITNWELNRKNPTVKHIPKINFFLGYVPIKYENKIVNYRIQRGITQKEMAKILEIDQSTLAKIEDENSKISTKVQKEISRLSYFL